MKQLKKQMDANPTLKTYCATLESAGFNPYNITQQSNVMTVLAQKEDDHLHELRATIDSETNRSTITIKSRLIWAEHAKLALPGHDVQLEIDGEEDYNEQWNHSFILRATKTETNVKPQYLVKTIEKMLDEIKSANEAMLAKY